MTPLMKTPDFLPVTFSGAVLHIFEYRDEPCVVVKPLAESIGLAWKPQYLKLVSGISRWQVVRMVIQIPGDDQEREVLAMPVRKLPGWLSSINAGKVSATIRERLVEFQNECDDALWAYWQQHRAAAEPPAVLKTDIRLKKMLAVVKMINVQNGTSSLPARRLLDTMIAETATGLGFAYQPDLLDGAKS